MGNIFFKYSIHKVLNHKTKFTYDFHIGLTNNYFDLSIA